MSNKNRILVFATAALLAALFMVLKGAGQVKQNDQQGPRRGNQVDRSPKDLDDAARPMVDFGNSLQRESVESAERKLKNTRYDRYGAVQSQPDSRASEVIWEPEWWLGLPDLPGEQSDVVVEGIVADAKAFLSEDKTGVYSEFTIRVSKVLKVSTELQVELGDMVITERFGGKVRYPSGQVILYRIEGQGAPMTGKRYLFFLAKGNQRNYRLLTAYEIQGKEVFCLDGSRINSRGKGNWNFDKHNGEDVNSFMESVGRSVNNSRGKGKQP